MITGFRKRRHEARGECRGPHGRGRQQTASDRASLGPLLSAFDNPRLGEVDRMFQDRPTICWQANSRRATPTTLLLVGICDACCRTRHAKPARWMFIAPESGYWQDELKAV